MSTEEIKDKKLLHEEITEEVIGVFFHVYNTLGYGFPEKVYHKAMLISLRKEGWNVEGEKKISVYFEGENVGDYYADIVVEGKVILELKSVENILKEHEIQLMNYLRSTEMEVGLLLNFGKSAQFKRKYFTNDKKKLREYEKE
ncbi:MAG: GxxExxY protein [Chitinophagales bacterium]|nr:GxxExxY protein [Chitinophagales bacterium]